jgi:putative peptidoglycan lipid II flippase
MKIRPQTVAGGAAVLMAGTLLSRVLGWVRDKAIYYEFGASARTDAYWLAFNIPDLLYYMLAGGALSAAFIPVFTRYLADKDDETSSHVGSTIANLLMLVSPIGIVLWIALAPYLVKAVAWGFDPGSEKYRLCVLYSRILAPMVFFTTLSALASGILNSYRHFTAPAIAWCAYNVAIIAAAFLLAPRMGIPGLCIGVIVGSVLMVVVQAPAVLRCGFRYRPVLDLRHPGVRRIGVLFFPLMISLGISQISLLMMPQILASFFSEGAVTAVRAANRLIILPLGLFAVSISTAAFPTLTTQAMLEITPEFRRTLAKTLRVILVLAIPSTIALMVLNECIVRTLWSGGDFGEGATAAAAFALFFFAIGLVGHSSIQLLNRGFYALHNTVTPAIVGVATIGLNVALVLWLRGSGIGYGSPAVASSAAVLVNMAVTAYLLRRRVGPMDGSAIVRCAGKTLVASLAMGVVCFVVATLVGQLVGAPTPRFIWTAPEINTIPSLPVVPVLVQLAASAAAGVAVLVAALRLLRVEEAEVAWQAIGRRLGLVKGK